MVAELSEQMKRGRTFMCRLRTDVRGNALAIMAAALVPMAGMVGGGIDLARMYITKTRLQHACDAGALAGRKLMGGGQWSQNGNAPNVMARRFFAANFKDGSYGSTGLTYTFSEDAGKVSGTASANLPMTLTRVIGATSTELDVTCEAEMRLPNTDVMFVLDNTGSMGDKAVSTDSQTKLEALKSSVKCFYEILARLDTNENCVGGAPSGGTSSQVQIRFGFMPYDMNVNVGRLLPTSYFADRWTYQSRAVVNVYGQNTGYTDPDQATRDTYTWSNYSNKTATTANEADCKALVDPRYIQQVKLNATLGLGKNESGGGLEGHGGWQADQTWQDVEREFTSWAAGAGKCKYKTRTRDFKRTYSYTWVPEGNTGAVLFKAWRYKPVDFDISGLKNGTAWNAGVALPLSNTYTNATVAWNGCIEERHTVRQASYLPIPADANDLDIDNAPMPGNPNTLWGPALNGAVFFRHPTPLNASSEPWTTAEITTFTLFSGSGQIGGTAVSKGYTCVRQAAKLQEWPVAADYEAYVDSMVKGGNTYHDIGMLWGARFLSPTGLFKSENELTPTGGKIQRNLIFMTDGDACTESHNYQAYGVGFYDRRQTDVGTEPTDGCQTGPNGTLTQQVTARTAALCTAVKNMPDTTLWVIWFGVRNSTIENQLTACATPTRFYSARNQTDLQNTFRTIANQISQLRITN